MCDDGSITVFDKGREGRIVTIDFMRTLKYLGISDRSSFQIALALMLAEIEDD